MSFAVGDLVTVKPEVIAQGWPEFQGKIGEVVGVWGPGHNAIFTYDVRIDGITYRPSSTFGFDDDELDEFCGSEVE